MNQFVQIDGSGRKLQLYLQMRMKQSVQIDDSDCKGFNKHLKEALYNDWIIYNTADVTYFQNPIWTCKLPEEKKIIQIMEI